MRSKILAGTTSLSAPIYVANSSVAGGLGALVYNTAGLVGEYRRAGQSTWTSITLVAGTLGTWTSGGWIADGGLAGSYEVGVPNAALAAGVPWVEVRYYGATSMTPVLLYIELDQVNYQDGVRAGLTSLPAAAAGAAGGLPLIASGFKQGQATDFIIALLDTTGAPYTQAASTITVTRDLIATAGAAAVTATAAGTMAQIGTTNRYHFAGTAADWSGVNATFTFSGSGGGQTIGSPTTWSVNTTY